MGGGGGAVRIADNVAHDGKSDDGSAFVGTDTVSDAFADYRFADDARAYHDGRADDGGTHAGTDDAAANAGTHSGAHHSVADTATYPVADAVAHPSSYAAADAVAHSSTVVQAAVEATNAEARARVVSQLQPHPSRHAVVAIDPDLADVSLWAVVVVERGRRQQRLLLRGGELHRELEHTSGLRLREAVPLNGARRLPGGVPVSQVELLRWRRWINRVLALVRYRSGENIFLFEDGMDIPNKVRKEEKMFVRRERGWEMARKL